VGGCILLNRRVALVHCFDIRDGRYFLDAAVVLRGTRPDWYATATPPDPRLRLPPQRTSGGGAGAGRHFIYVDRDNRAVYVNRDQRIPLDEFNVLLLEGADDPDQAPVLHERLTIDPDFGPAPALPAAPTTSSSSGPRLVPIIETHSADAKGSPPSFFTAMIFATKNLEERMMASSRVRDFVGPP
jgi:hypothetical protein